MKWLHLMNLLILAYVIREVRVIHREVVCAREVAVNTNGILWSAATGRPPPKMYESRCDIYYEDAE